MIGELLPLTKRRLKILSGVYIYGPLHNSELSRLVDIDKQNVSLQVNKLLKRNIVKVHKKIGRSIEYSLSKDIEKKLGSLINEFRKEELFIDSPVIERIRNYILKKFPELVKIYVIGSYLTNSAKNDLDLVVIFENSVPSKIKKVVGDIDKLYGVRTDLIPYSEESFKKERDSDSLFYQTTFKNRANHLLIYGK
tara:strand:+ start:797 stop:1378 length:582 start_codon:yes stop_codon:yes gene_type:complete